MSQNSWDSFHLELKASLTDSNVMWGMVYFSTQERRSISRQHFFFALFIYCLFFKLYWLQVYNMVI